MKGASLLGQSERVVPVREKPPRGKGYDAKSLKRLQNVLEGHGDKTLKQWAREKGLSLPILDGAFSDKYPQWWKAYKNNTGIQENTCEGCGLLFVPNVKTQRFHSRRCADRTRVDREYFGGNRAFTRGLAEQVCQLCRRTVHSGLSSHHVFGKENDPDNKFLIALCRGCHKLVTMLATRNFVDDVSAWERLILLAGLRRHGGDPGLEVTLKMKNRP